MDTASVDLARTASNLLVYAVGVGACVAGALGIIEFVELPSPVSWALFFLGLAVVVFVHERLDGPF